MNRKLLITALSALLVNADLSGQINHQEVNAMSYKTIKMITTQTNYKRILIEGIEIFYREAGNPGNPTILLLHGFPSSSHMYRDLIEDLSGSFHLIAPDYPGFGNSDAPSRETFKYTFDHLTSIIEQFIDSIGLSKFSLYLQDYGSPIGFRIANRRPHSIQALILQIANAYLEGIGPAFAAVPEFWKNRNAATEKPVRAQLTLEGTKFQYLDGIENITRVNPDAYVYDQFFLDRPGNNEIQMDLFYDYQHNVPLYDTWHKYLRTYKPQTLIAWGKNDQFFTAAGANAYLKDVPDAEIHLLNSGHFALEEFHYEVSLLIKSFFEKKGLCSTGINE